METITFNRTFTEALAVVQILAVASEEVCGLIASLWQNWGAPDVSSQQKCVTAWQYRLCVEGHQSLLTHTQLSNCHMSEKQLAVSGNSGSLAMRPHGWTWKANGVVHGKWHTCIFQLSTQKNSDEMEENCISTTQRQLRFPGSTSYFYDAIISLIF